MHTEGHRFHSATRRPISAPWRLKNVLAVARRTVLSRICEFEKRSHCCDAIGFDGFAFLFISAGCRRNFPLSQVVKCWTEGVQKMRVGGKSQLV